MTSKCCFGACSCTLTRPELGWKRSPAAFENQISPWRYSGVPPFEYLQRLTRSIPCKLTICGDFFQLPPVTNYLKGCTQPVCFAFEAASWGRCIQRQMLLTQVFRQSEGCKHGSRPGHCNSVLTSIDALSFYSDPQPVEVVYYEFQCRKPLPSSARGKVHRRH